MRDQKSSQKEQHEITTGDPVFNELNGQDLPSLNRKSEEKRQVGGKVKAAQSIDHATHENHRITNQENQSNKPLQQNLQEEQWKILKFAHVSKNPVEPDVLSHHESNAQKYKRKKWNIVLPGKGVEVVKKRLGIGAQNQGKSTHVTYFTSSVVRRRKISSSPDSGSEA